VTALAHPSSLFIGTTHGVYVLGESGAQEKSEVQEVQELRSCLEVLQKPSEAMMRSRGAVVARPESQEMVYSDSAFWFHTPTTRWQHCSDNWLF
jgi:fucose-1-phosphate guanylyltransferase